MKKVLLIVGIISMFGVSCKRKEVNPCNCGTITSIDTVFKGATESIIDVNVTNNCTSTNKLIGTSTYHSPNLKKGGQYCSNTTW